MGVGVGASVGVTDGEGVALGDIVPTDDALGVAVRSAVEAPGRKSTQNRTAAIAIASTVSATINHARAGRRCLRCRPKSHT